MRHETIGHGLRALRHRRGLRQREASALAQIARSVLASLEAGNVGPHSVEALTRAAAAVGASIRIELTVPGGDLRRLLDADHAAIQAEWKQMLERSGWLVDAELSFNNYGERGSIDLFAWHAATRTLLVVESKTVIVDIQDLLAGIDRKVRIGRSLAAERGWRPVRVVPMLLVAEGSTARRRIGDHAPLFSHLSLRGRAALAWLRQSQTLDGSVQPTGVLCMTKLSQARPGDRRRAGRQRIRPLRANPRSRLG
jgi:transcriptional regulator with XRE-family HTH domain